MPAPDWEDLNEFFDDEEFSDIATFTPESGPAFGVVGNFDDAYSNPELSEYPMDTQKPQFICPFAKVQNVHRGMACQINEVDYLVRTNEPEGSGLALIVLEYA